MSSQSRKMQRRAEHKARAERYQRAYVEQIHGLVEHGRFWAWSRTWTTQGVRAAKISGAVALAYVLALYLWGLTLGS